MVATTVIKWKLNELMSAQRKTSRDLANFLKIHENSVYRLRKEDKMPRLSHETLNGICRFLQCQPGDLLVYLPDEGE
ncbi:MAG: helix-turn-helix domain-containing protein [Scytolyngbya sp. HA4215-MV1]|nr:helix-turn-helix domain-containing protein [Scytolyngbya sp. HA4215-MV1]